MCVSGGVGAAGRWGGGDTQPEFWHIYAVRKIARNKKKKKKKQKKKLK